MNPIKKIRLIRRTNKFLKTAPSITTGGNLMLQGAAFIAHGVALFTDMMPEEYRLLASGVVAVLQGLVSLLAQGSEVTTTEDDDL